MITFSEFLKLLAFIAAFVLVMAVVVYFANEHEKAAYDIRLPDGTVLRGATSVHHFPHRIEFKHNGRRHVAYGAATSESGE